jgi:hypothetical protein
MIVVTLAADVIVASWPACPARRIAKLSGAALGTVLIVWSLRGLAGPDFGARRTDQHSSSQPATRDALDGFPLHFSHTNSLSPPPEIFSVALTDVLIFEIERPLNLVENPSISISTKAWELRTPGLSIDSHFS